MIHAVSMSASRGPGGSSPSHPALHAEAIQAAESVRRASSTAGATRLRAMADAHYEFIWRWLRGLGVASASIDDATQQVFWIASQKLDVIDPGSERAFLMSTARGVAANSRRASARGFDLADDSVLDSHADLALDPEEAMAAKEARQVLERLLEALPAELREVFVLFELEGLTAAKIAELLELPPGTVASRLRRARDEFQAGVKRLQAGGGRS